MGIVDGHCDTVVSAYEKGMSLLKNSGHIDLERLAAFDSPVQFFAIWLKKSYYPISLRQTLKYIDFYYNELFKNNAVMGHINSFHDIVRNKAAGRISSILSLEGCEALEGELSTLRMLYRLGVRGAGLTWNHRNALGDGVLERDTHGGLTIFGKACVQEMNRIGMIVDVSHLSEDGFWDVDRVATVPYIASHSNARSICDVPRNLSDDQIRAISVKGGVIGVNLYTPFISLERKTDIKDVLCHIDHVISVGGCQAVGLGCDFDGIESMPEGIKDVAGIKKLIEAVSHKHGGEVAELFAEKNFLRVLQKILN